MELGELINRLKEEDYALVVPNGFGSPHSYRGYYEQLAFEPAKDVTIGSMLKCARACVGKIFIGYKGGNFEMNTYTECWLAEYGHCGEELGGRLLEYMIQEARQSKSA
jgi:hypothetical protein